MKKIIASISGAIILLIISSCTKDKTQNSSIALLKIDYTTNIFEGGVVFQYPIATTASDSLPINVTYVDPGDFGGLTCTYSPTGDIIFDGSIIWSGTGNINFPTQFNSPSTFPQSPPIPVPDTNEFQILHYLSNEAIDYTSIWNAVSQLDIVNDYLLSGKKVGLFLYTPSVGAGNPAEYDWFIILNK